MNTADAKDTSEEEGEYGTSSPNAAPENNQDIRDKNQGQLEFSRQNQLNQTLQSVSMIIISSQLVLLLHMLRLAPYSRYV
jgi:hypothetical protein